MALAAATVAVTCEPVPPKLIICGEPVALSVMVAVSRIDPVDCGVKMMLRSQLAPMVPLTSDAGGMQSPALVPKVKLPVVAVSAVKFRSEPGVPMLVRVTGSVLVVWYGTVPKANVGALAKFNSYAESSVPFVV